MNFGRMGPGSCSLIFLSSSLRKAVGFDSWWCCVGTDQCCSLSNLRLRKALCSAVLLPLCWKCSKCPISHVCLAETASDLALQRKQSLSLFFPHISLSISASFLVVTVLNHWEAAPGCEFSCGVKEGCSTLLLCNAVKNNKIKSITTSARVYPFFSFGWESILPSFEFEESIITCVSRSRASGCAGDILLEYYAFDSSTAKFVAATLIWTCVNPPPLSTDSKISPQ